MQREGGKPSGTRTGNNPEEAAPPQNDFEPDPYPRLPSGAPVLCWCPALRRAGSWSPASTRL
jgi:hypothetical protein